MKKYNVRYNASPNACGVDHEKDFGTIKEVDCYLDGIQNSIHSYVAVYDNELNDYVFYKRCMEKPEINLLTPENHFRDLRTKDKKSH